MTDQIQPSWDDVPPFAKYIAMDGDGYWWWYEFKPNELQSERMWSLPPSKGRSGKVETYNPEWSSTLMTRPTKKKKSDV